MSRYFTRSGYEVDALELTRQVHEDIDRDERIWRRRAERVQRGPRAGRDSGDLAALLGALDLHQPTGWGAGVTPPGPQPH